MNKRWKAVAIAASCLALLVVSAGFATTPASAQEFGHGGYGVHGGYGGYSGRHGFYGRHGFGVNRRWYGHHDGYYGHYGYRPYGGGAFAVGHFGSSVW